MIYITGDIHGKGERIIRFIEEQQLTHEDIFVILGDVGFNYYGNNRGDKRLKKKINKFGVPILSIHGNHEMRPQTLDYYHEQKWNDGIVFVENEYSNLLFAKDGETFNLNGISAIVIGGRTRSKSIIVL